MLTLTYEYKLQPKAEQVQEIERVILLCRNVWNYALRERKDWLNSRKCHVNACSITSEYILPADGPYPNYAKQCKSLTAAKAEFPELKSVNAQVLQQVLRKLETAFVDMQRKRMGFPRFKNYYRMRSFVFPQMLKNCWQGNHIKLPQLGLVKLIKSRDIPDGFEIKQVAAVLGSFLKSCRQHAARLSEKLLGISSYCHCSVMLVFPMFHHMDIL